MNSAPQLILLPGLGADERLLEPQRRAFPQLIVPPWIPPRTKESLADYAARMAESVTHCTPHALREEKPLAEREERPHAEREEYKPRLVLGGVSFGGMLAYEMARHLKPDAVVLIASCRNRRGLRWLYRAGRPLWPLVPAWTWERRQVVLPPFRALLQPDDPRRAQAVEPDVPGSGQSFHALDGPRDSRLEAERRWRASACIRFMAAATG